MNIVFLIRRLGNGGAERQLSLLARALHQKGHRIEVVTFYPGGAYETQLITAGVPVLCIGKRGRWDLIRTYWRAIRWLRRKRPSVLYSFLSGANILAAIVKPFIPATAVVWGIRSSRVDVDAYDWLIGASMRLETRLCSVADLIIANSQAGRDWALRARFPKEKMVVIPNAVDTVEFRPDANERRQFRASLGISDRERLIGLVGRLDPMKGHTTFLEAAALIRKQNGHARFVCVGDGPEDYLFELQRRSESLGVHDVLSWTGYVRNPRSVYNGIDLLCLPSFGEGFPNVVAEAMACGTQCVVADAGDAGRIVGRFGLVFTSITPEAIAKAISDALVRSLDPECLRRAIVENFSIDGLCDKTVDVLSRASSAKRLSGAKHP